MAEKDVIAFVTCREKPGLTEDDQLAAEELRRRGISVIPWIWNQPPQLKPDVLVVRSPWDYVHHYQAFRDWVDSVEQSDWRVFNAPADMRRNLSKTYLFDLAGAGVPTVESYLVSSMEQLMNVTWAAHQEWVLKPVVSASSYKTFRESGDDLTTIRARAQDILQSGEVLAQPFYKSVVEEGEWSLVYLSDGQQTLFSHALIKRPAVGDFRVQTEHGGSVFHAHAESEMVRVGESALSALNLRPWLYARVDLVLSSSGPVVSEVELIEPELFFGVNSKAPEVFADCLLRHLSEGRGK